MWKKKREEKKVEKIKEEKERKKKNNNKEKQYTADWIVIMICIWYLKIVYKKFTYNYHQWNLLVCKIYVCIKLNKAMFSECEIVSSPHNNIFKVIGWCRPISDIHLKRVHLSTS